MFTGVGERLNRARQRRHAEKFGHDGDRTARRFWEEGGPGARKKGSHTSVDVEAEKLKLGAVGAPGAWVPPPGLCLARGAAGLVQTNLQVRKTIDLAGEETTEAEFAIC